MQKYAFIYSLLFVSIFLGNYVPFIHDKNGNMFGLFHLDLIDDLLHLGSALWAFLASRTSSRQSLLYFKIFGVLYGLDGIVGLISGSGYLDLGIFIYGPNNLPLQTRFFANIPHIAIGGIAIYIGYFFKFHKKK